MINPHVLNSRKLFSKIKFYQSMMSQLGILFLSKYLDTYHSFNITVSFTQGFYVVSIDEVVDYTCSSESHLKRMNEPYHTSVDHRNNCIILFSGSY
jgi:hypothetical protein